MSEIDITQSEADILIKMEKHKIDDKFYNYPINQESLTIPLTSFDRRESFQLDINRKGKAELKVTYQNRARKAIILLRLDLNGSKHRNPDGEELECPHLHIYKEGFGDKWAKTVTTDDFANIDNIQNCIDDFMKYCNITEPPRIQRGLFA